MRLVKNLKFCTAVCEYLQQQHNLFIKTRLLICQTCSDGSTIIIISVFENPPLNSIACRRVK